MSANVYQEFAWRGMVYDGTEGVADVLAREKVTAYIGFDPTAASLHIGSLLPMMALARLQRFGHSPIAIVGGGTGLIGDPSGKAQERALMTREQVERNLQGIRTQLARVLDFEASPNPARIVNNADWLCQLDMMTFLRDVGKNFTVNYMLAKESVNRRLEQEEGISFTEFSYLLLQAYDFVMLYDRYGCTMQLGGSDQWGNITAGCDLIRKTRGGKAHGLVLPLVTSATGVKFGKTEAGTVWLDPELTRPYDFYQFWLNTDDRDVVPYLKYFTFLGETAIRDLEASLVSTPEKREAQRALAREVTRLVHGPEALQSAERGAARMFGGTISEASAGELLADLAHLPYVDVEFAAQGNPMTRLAVASGLESSSSSTIRLIRGGGLYLQDKDGEQRVSDERGLVTSDRAIGGEFFVLRKGKDKRVVVRVKKMN
jgi:tyrosyl-tRNA synthetase